jgi:PEGA domain-containing protein
MKKAFCATLLCCLLAAQSLAVHTTPQQEPQKTQPEAKPATTQAPPGDAAQPKPVTPPLVGFGLEDGTPVKLRLTRNLSSATDKTGDTVDFEVMEDVSVNGLVVIPRGSTAWATITDAQPKRRMGRGGKLDVNIDSVRLKDGEKTALRAVKENKGGGHVGAMTGAMVATGIVFFPAAPLFLFMHGKDISIPKGTEITAYVAGNIPLEKAKFMEQPSTPAAAVVPVAASSSSPAQTNVAIASAPAGADVEVDGKFVGSTPTSVAVASGDHTIKVSKKGYKAWERTLTTSGTNANVNAELEQEK